MPERSENDGLTPTPWRSGLNNLLRVCRWIGVGEAADLLLLIVQQPADTLLWWVPLNLRSVLVRQIDTMASDAPHRGDFITPILIDLGVGDHLLSLHI